MKENKFKPLSVDNLLRRKAFARHWLTNGYDKKAAAIDVGFPSANAEEVGAELINTPEVKAFIRKHEQYQQGKFNVTRNSLAYELEEAREIALSKKNANAMVAATKGKMDLYGLAAPKQVKIDADHKHRQGPSVSDISLEERIALLTSEDPTDKDIIEEVATSEFMQ